LATTIQGFELDHAASGNIKFQADGDRDIASGATNQIDQVKDGALTRIQ
jgi:hypothetical protein